MSVVEKQKPVSRRRFLTMIVRDIPTIGIVSTVGVICGMSAISAYKDWQHQNDERENTGGYQINDLDPNTKIITLLPSGKTMTNDPFFSYPRDIRAKTITNALEHIAKSCDIKQTTAINETINRGTAISGLVVEVDKCE